MSTKVALSALETFSAGQMAKVDVFESERLLLGLNCLEEGQSQKLHTHPDADKFYYVISGRAEFNIGHTVVQAAAGDVVLCPAGLPHGIERALERTTVLVGIAPWRKKKE